MTRLSEHAVTWVLVVFGVGITIGTLVGGRLSDWRQMPVILAGFGLLIAMLLVMPLVMRVPWAMVSLVFLWGMVSFGTGAPMQARIVDQAKGAPNLASTLNQGAFNFGNAMGASLGGVVLAAGYGYVRLPIAAAAVSVVGLGAAGVAKWLKAFGSEVSNVTGSLQ